MKLFYDSNEWKWRARTEKKEKIFEFNPTENPYKMKRKVCGRVNAHKSKIEQYAVFKSRFHWI